MISIISPPAYGRCIGVSRTVRLDEYCCFATYQNGCNATVSEPWLERASFPGMIKRGYETRTPFPPDCQWVLFLGPRGPGDVAVLIG